MRHSVTVVALFALLNAVVFGQNTRFRERYAWRTLNFQFPDERTRQSAINSQEYIPINNVPHGMEIWRDRFFVTVPRWKAGVASTLNYFRVTGDSNTSPTLIPYPNYETNRIRNNETSFNNRIVSVVRMHVDACDRMWFVDTGMIDIVGAARQAITPRLFVFDLRTDRVLRTYTFPSSDLSADSMLGGSIVVDVTSDNCNRAFAYIPDFQAYRLIVYSYELNSSWRIRHPYFYFDPFATPLVIGGVTFIWVDGILGATLSARQNDGYRTLYFTGLASNYQFSVSTRYLRDRSIATNTSTLLEGYRFLGSRGSNMQTTAHMMDERTGILFYALPNRNGLGCWNSNRFANNFSPDTNAILATDDETMIMPIDLILDDADNVWLNADRLAVSNTRGLNAQDVNFRFFTATIRDAVRGTVCDPDGSGGGGGDGGYGFDLNNRFSSSSSDGNTKTLSTLGENLRAGGGNANSTSRAHSSRRQ